MFVVEIYVDLDSTPRGQLHGELAAIVKEVLDARAPGYVRHVRVTWREAERGAE